MSKDIWYRFEYDVFYETLGKTGKTTIGLDYIYKVRALAKAKEHNLMSQEELCANLSEPDFKVTKVGKARVFKNTKELISHVKFDFEGERLESFQAIVNKYITPKTVFDSDVKWQ